MFIIESDTTVRRPTPDLACVVGSVDTIILPAKVQRMGAKRVIRTGRNVLWPLRIAFEHVWCRPPVGPFDHANNRSPATPREVFGQRNAGRVKLVGQPVLAPEMQRPRSDIDKNGAVSQVAEVRLPFERPVVAAVSVTEPVCARAGVASIVAAPARKPRRVGLLLLELVIGSSRSPKVLVLSMMIWRE